MTDRGVPIRDLGDCSNGTSYLIELVVVVMALVLFGGLKIGI